MSSNGWDDVSASKGYQLLTGSYDFSGAAKACRDLGGRLATFKNTEEFLWLKDNGKTKGDT